MKVSLKKAFNILDGRLSTNIGDVYEMLNYIHDADLYTHQLPNALSILKNKNPKWFTSAKLLLESIKEKHNTNDFNELMSIIDKDYSDYIIVLNQLNKD